MVCISKHKIMLLVTLLLRIYPNYVLYGMYEMGHYLYLIILTLFYHSSYHSFYVHFVHRGMSYKDVFCLPIFSLNNQLCHVFQDLC